MELIAALILSIASLIGGAATTCPAPAPVDPDVCVLIAGHNDTDPDGIARLIEAEGTGNFDYIGAPTGQAGTWVAESGDGRIVGYSLAEDSEVWTTEHCALTH